MPANSRHRALLLFSRGASLGFLMAACAPAWAYEDVTCPPGQDPFCGDLGCDISVCAPWRLERLDHWPWSEEFPKVFPAGLPCTGRPLHAPGTGGLGNRHACVDSSRPHGGCRWKSGPPLDQRYDFEPGIGQGGGQVCDAAAAALPRPDLDAPQILAAQNALVAAFNDAAGGDSGWGHAAIGVFRNKYMGAKLEGPSGDTMGGQVANLGRFVSAQLGVGTCKRHLYNKSESSWGVGMVYAGLCHLEGQPAGNDAMCIVPKHQTAELDYSNTAVNSNTAKIILSRGDYTQTFELDPVSCRINGYLQYGDFNHPAKGDINVY